MVNDLLRRSATGDHSENVFDGQPAAADDGLAAVDLGIRRDALQKRALVHIHILLAAIHTGGGGEEQ